MDNSMDKETEVQPSSQSSTADEQEYDPVTANSTARDNETEGEDDDEEEAADTEDEEDEDDDDDEDDRQSVDSNPIHIELQGIVKSIKGFEIKDWTDPARLFGKGATRWLHIGEASEKTGDCILHFLMKDDDATPEQNKELAKTFKLIAKYHPRLLTLPNYENMTPLYIALIGLDHLDRLRVSRIKRSLFPAKLSERAEKRLAKAIATPCGSQNQNCLHLALKNKFRDSSLLEAMVQLASQKAINARDNSNWTSLHRAVDYRHSSEDTLKIVRQLIARGESRCGKFDDSQPRSTFDGYVTMDREELFVYEYHLKTRARMLAPAASATSSKLGSRKDVAREDKKRIESGERQLKDPKKAAETQEQPSKDAGDETPPKPGLARANTSLQRRTDGRAKLKHSADSRKKSSKNSSSKEAERRELWLGQIREELKLHCLRTRSIAQAERFLYGSNKEGIQLYFDYNGLPTENADAVTFYDNFKDTRFDEVLQYVEFPPVRLWKTEIPRGETFQRHKDLLQSKSGGRKDLLFFFAWLKDKKVKHIINLTVHDFVDPHDDEVIEACLTGFRVDVLDWLKPDLDPEMLCNAFPDVRELHLRWGGNNAILRAWGEPEGLRALKNLEHVYLYYNEASDCSPAKVERFKARFEMPASVSALAKDGDLEDKESILVPTITREADQVEQPLNIPKTRIRVSIRQSQTGETFREAGAIASPVVAPGQSTITVHKWLESIDTFNDKLRTLMTSLRMNSHKGDEVRVALIDDGVDFCEKEFCEKIMHGKSFAYCQHGNRREKQWYVSELGHGTVMAHMILRVCPMARIYPIKLDTFRTPKKKHMEIRTVSAIQGIEAAVRNEVQVIACLGQSNNRTKKRKLPDEGQYSGDHYPAAWGSHKFFRIGASQADGHPYSRVPVNQVHYLFPGVDVVRANKRGIKLRILEDNIAFTGSSVSTALAAGLAALVLWFAIIGAKYSQDENQTDGLDFTDVKKLQDIKDMKQAFQKLGAGRVPNDKFIEIWSVLERPTESLKDHHGHNKADVRESRRIIFNLARNLVTKS
ncbi:uncharacterized protein DSM5745_08606 [Aspergillus mulundensis]|uniref:Peptidase S8/S53 domain-containing protein n=1 Tax=Aspergillus mulundensis TaxID=1810919 RepID=A0A3D8R4E3_9EURO|nr:hypothetical protein DSM5745_08606 [Aspergillus mulundensis]RDW68846.1 hypothetical protein DSM5745_08606 [Aspergillus mulundensis]